MLQSHSPITPDPSLSGPLTFKATVAAPQWQEPVYSLLSSISAAGSGPVNFGGSYGGSRAAPLYLFTVRDQRSTSWSVLAYMQRQFSLGDRIVWQ
jgi:hypothetical protein